MNEASHGRERSSWGFGATGASIRRTTSGSATRRRGSRVSPRLFYALKPLIPRHVQLALRRAHARRQRGASSPRWPIEACWSSSRTTVPRAPARPAADGSRSWTTGRTATASRRPHARRRGPRRHREHPRVREVERAHGFVSSWNFVAEEYPIPDGLFERCARTGCEIGLHGIHHDGKLFRRPGSASRPTCRRSTATSRSGRRSASARRPRTATPTGCRSSACLYDSSFPDTDPFEPQAGRLLLDPPVLHRRPGRAADHARPGPHAVRDPAAGPIGLWTRRATGSSDNHGLINLIVHPDYLIDAGAARPLRGVPRLARHARGRLARAAARGRGWWKARRVSVDSGQVRRLTDGRRRGRRRSSTTSGHRDRTAAEQQREIAAAARVRIMTCCDAFALCPLCGAIPRLRPCPLPSAVADAAASPAHPPSISSPSMPGNIGSESARAASRSAAGKRLAPRAAPGRLEVHGRRVVDRGADALPRGGGEDAVAIVDLHHEQVEDLAGRRRVLGRELERQVGERLAVRAAASRRCSFQPSRCGSLTRSNAAWRLSSRLVAPPRMWWLASPGAAAVVPQRAHRRGQLGVAR